MTTRFKVCPHSERQGEEMAEVWVRNQFVGALYPGRRADELRFVSKHLVSHERGVPAGGRSSGTPLA